MGEQANYTVEEGDLVLIESDPDDCYDGCHGIVESINGPVTDVRLSDGRLCWFLNWELEILQKGPLR